MNNAQLLATQAKILGYRELYLELLKDERIPYDFCMKVKEKIKALEATIAFVDEFTSIPPLDLDLNSEDLKNSCLK